MGIQAKLNQQQTLIMGFGSEILCDDGIAIKLVNQLKMDLNTEMVLCSDTNLISLETLETLVGFKKIILIDAVQEKEIKVGVVNFFRVDQFKNSLHLVNIHDLTIHQLLEIALVLKIPITEDILIITINVEETEIFEKNLSSRMQFLFQDIYQKIFTEVNQFIGIECQEK